LPAPALNGTSHGADLDEPPTPVRRLVQLLVRERGEIGLVYLYAALIGLFSLTLPLGVQAIVGLVSGGLVLQPVVLLIAFVIAGTLATGVLQVVQLGVVERLQQRVFARMALEYAFRVPRVQLERVLGEDLPEKMNRFFEVVIIQKSLAKLLTESVTALLSIVFGLVLLTFYHPYFSLFGVLLLAALAGILWLTGRQGLATSLTESKYKYRVAHWLQELARSTALFRHAPRSRLPLERMDAEVSGYVGARRRHFRVLVRQSLAIVLFKTVITGGLLVLGSLLVINRQISLGQFVASELVIVAVLAGVEKLVLALSTVYDILTSVEKAGHVTELPLDDLAQGTVALPAGARATGLAVTARNLSYRYQGAERHALRGVSITVGAGERVAITGTEGAGESTLLGVLTGSLTSFEGALTYDGVSARDAELADVRAEIAVARAELDLFDGTIEENVALGRPGVGAAEVLAALERVQLAELVHALPDGLRTRVGDAARLPLSVERKIVLARTLAGRPRLLAFDEFFHQLDPVYKQTTVDMLTAPDAPWSIIAVSHDPVFLSRCHRIYVLEHGRVARSGSYDELAGDPYFRSVVQSHPVRAANAPSLVGARS
jgi:ABC-type bacteriocin/lantibiotic exporter with double-glycine peptidase domain